jgi:26S proteasome regulatory subunit N1
LIRKQVEFLLARQQIYWDLDGDRVEDADELREIMNNSRLSQNFLNLARELDIMEPKIPEEICICHLQSYSQYLKMYAQKKIPMMSRKLFFENF